MTQQTEAAPPSVEDAYSRLVELSRHLGELERDVRELTAQEIRDAGKLGARVVPPLSLGTPERELAKRLRRQVGEATGTAQDLRNRLRTPILNRT